MKVYRLVGIEKVGRLHKNIALSIAHGYDIVELNSKALEGVYVVDEHNKPMEFWEYFADILVLDVVFDELDDATIYVLTVDDYNNIEVWTLKNEGVENEGA
jgi:hypothetical protein